MGFIKATGPTGLEIVQEVLAGIPLMKMIGGAYPGLRIITKAGAFGQADAIYFSLRKLGSVHTTKCANL